MSMYLEFTPHSWYMGFAIRDERDTTAGDCWSAYIDDGNTYSIVALTATTLTALKAEIRNYHINAHNGYGERIAAKTGNK